VHAATRRAFNNNKLVLGWGAKPEFIIKRQNAGKAFFAASSSCHRCKIFVYHIAIIAAGEVKTKSWIRGFMCRGAEHRAKGSKHPNHPTIGASVRPKERKAQKRGENRSTSVCRSRRLKTEDCRLETEEQRPKTEDREADRDWDLGQGDKDCERG